MGEDILSKIDFLTSENNVMGEQKVLQSKIECLTGVDWTVYQIVREILKSAVQVSEDFEIMRGCGECGEPPPLTKQGESRKELWGMLDELDTTDFEKQPKPQKQVTKSPKNAKKRGRPAKNTQIVGQKTLDMFVVRGRKSEVVQAVCVSSMAQSDGVVASPSSRRHEKTVNISTVAKEGGISARTGGAAVETSIVTQRSRRNSVVFVDEVQPSDETDAIQILGEAHTLH